MSLAPHEQLLVAALFGWLVCGACFLLIPSWRERDVRRMSTEELRALASSAVAELRRRAP
jgi:hypothetical protein